LFIQQLKKKKSHADYLARKRVVPHWLRRSAQVKEKMPVARGIPHSKLMQWEKKNNLPRVSTSGNPFASKGGWGRNHN